MAKADFVIIGAGLSGLACAITLQKHGLNSKIIEAQSGVGGRVKSHTTNDGFIIDQGFQVILNSYPEFSNFVDLEKLNLKKFNSGAMVFNGEKLVLLGNPVVHPETLYSTLFNEFTTIKDRALVLKLVLSAQLFSDDSSLGLKTTHSFLKDYGFSEKFIEFFWRPFLTGVYLDSSLAIGENYFKFLLRCFSLGKVTVPESGMNQLPLLLSEQLPVDSILLNQRVQSWASDHVILSTGEKLTAKKVICAFDPSLMQGGLNHNYFSVTTHYFTGSSLNETNWGKWLVLVPKKLGFGIDHMCLISNVAEKYGNGHPLLSVSLVGNKNFTVNQVSEEVDKIAKTSLNLKHIASTVVPKALPVMTGDTPGFKVVDGVLYCGDSLASPSINGALKSGRLCAEFLLKDLKI